MVLIGSTVYASKRFGYPWTSTTPALPGWSSYETSSEWTMSSSSRLTNNTTISWQAARRPMYTKLKYRKGKKAKTGARHMYTKLKYRKVKQGGLHGGVLSSLFYKQMILFWSVNCPHHPNKRKANFTSRTFQWFGKAFFFSRHPDSNSVSTLVLMSKSTRLPNVFSKKEICL